MVFCQMADVLSAPLVDIRLLCGILGGPMVNESVCFDSIPSSSSSLYYGTCRDDTAYKVWYDVMAKLQGARRIQRFLVSSRCSSRLRVHTASWVPLCPDTTTSITKIYFTCFLGIFKINSDANFKALAPSWHYSFPNVLRSRGLVFCSYIKFRTTDSSMALYHPVFEEERRGYSIVGRGTTEKVNE